MRQEPIIWFAMVFSTFIYALLGYIIVAPRTHGAFDDAFKSPIVLTLYGMVVVAFILATLMSSILRERPQRLRMLMSLAVYESCALFGLIAAMLANDWRLYLAPWAVALLGMFRVYPTAEAS